MVGRAPFREVLVCGWIVGQESQTTNPSIRLHISRWGSAESGAKPRHGQRRHALIIGDAALFAHRYPDRTRRRARHTIDTSTFFFFSFFSFNNRAEIFIFVMLLGVLHDEGEENKRFEMFIKNETKRGTCESCDELLTATAAPCCFGCSFLTPD